MVQHPLPSTRLRCFRRNLMHALGELKASIVRGDKLVSEVKSTLHFIPADFKLLPLKKTAKADIHMLQKGIIEFANESPIHDDSYFWRSAAKNGVWCQAGCGKIASSHPVGQLEPHEYRSSAAVAHPSAATFIL
ncbi:unnamed protein product [Haemonchus placei]|uniref:Uncharacterized protein n=1 Tax=Haemonchus placei TaxID=6290 RepID=A0A0N4WKA5_HAEPC|nr:unnamed protein product [Haemonchus placei]